MTKGFSATLFLLGAVALAAACAEPGSGLPPADISVTDPAPLGPDTVPDAPEDLLTISETIADSSPETVVADIAPETVADVAAETGPADVTVPFVLPDGLNGEMPAAGFQPLPNFAAVLDHTGAAVTPAELVGQWTVVWFYTAASTSG